MELTRTKQVEQVVWDELTHTQQVVWDAMVRAGATEEYINVSDILDAIKDPADRPSNVHAVVRRLKEKMPGRILSRMRLGYRIVEASGGSSGDTNVKRS